MCVCLAVGRICNTSSATADAPLIVAIRANERVPKVCVISYSMYNVYNSGVTLVGLANFGVVKDTVLNSPWI